MPSKIIQFLNSKVSRQLWWALGFSVVLHLFFFNGLPLILPGTDGEESIITAELVLTPPEVKQPKKIFPKEIKQAKPKTEEVLEPPAQTAEPTVETTSEVNPLLPLVEPPPPEEAIDANNPEYVEERIDVASKPTNIESWYDVKRSENGGRIGETHITYKVDNGKYKIESVSEAKGLAAIAYRGKLVQTSEGDLTENGLKPENFKHSYDNKENKTYSANFFWVENTLSLTTSKGQETVDLPTGAQDILSAQYQFMFVPPLQTMELFVTTGKSLKSYGYEFEGEALIKTKLGEFNTIHIIHRGEDENDRTEMWLAEEYHYLPIRIRKYLKDGSMLEQEMRKTNLVKTSLVKIPKVADDSQINNTELRPLD